MAKEKDTAAAERGALRRRRQLRQLLGAVVCVLVLLGIGSVFTGIFKLGSRLFDDSAEKAAFESRITYLVALDVVPFDSLSEASTGTLLDAAIWTTIEGTNSDDYEHDEVGAMYLPTVDIDAKTAELYGPDFRFNYQTFEDRGLTFTYVPEKEAYLLPITSAPSDYFPRVEKIKRESGGRKRVTVGYLSPYDSSGAINLTGNFTPVKYCDYIFTKIDGEYYLSAVEVSEMKVEASSSGSGASNDMNAMSVDPQAALQQAVPNLPVSGAAGSTANSAVSAAPDAAASAAADTTAAGTETTTAATAAG